LPFIDEDGLPSLDQKAFYAVQYFAVDREYREGCSLRGGITAVGAGDYEVTGNCEYAPEDENAHVYGYIAQTPLLEHSGGSGAEFPAGTHVHLYEDVSNAAIAYGTARADEPPGTNPAAYVSPANVGELGDEPGCVNCHGEPYLKHGYRAAQVAGIPDFAACKSCHYDDRVPFYYPTWQYMVDQPLNWGTAGLPAAEVLTLYAYTANIMNDTHMSHGMEFPYPMSMANCATCHEDKLSPGVLDDTNFTATTCKSCHAVQGTDAWPALADDEPGGPQPVGKYYQSHRAPPLDYLFAVAGVAGLAPHQSLQTDTPADCTVCHGAGTAPPFDAYHSGYDPRISDSAGDRYADDSDYTVSIDAISLAGNLLTIKFSAPDTTIVPEVLVSLYGWDTKHFLVPSHARDGTTDCIDHRGDPAGCDMEYEPGAGNNPLFADDPGSVAGAWSVTLDMAAYVPVNTDDIPTLITSGQVKKAEIIVTPELELGACSRTRTQACSVDGDCPTGETCRPVDVALNAVTQTFDLGTGTDVENYFKGDNAIVDINKCNACHDQLAVTFHPGSGRGGDIVACRSCHNTTFDGSHLEMTSRSTENYVHAIHTFQAFDTDDVFAEFDPVFSARYNQHIQHVFPNFTIRNCEGCHFEGTYNVPDQSQSMPGVQSTSFEVLTWYQMVSSRTCSTTTTQSCASAADCPQGTCSVTTGTMCNVNSDCPATETCNGGETCVSNIPSTIAKQDPEGRNIGTVASYVTGPASRACGGCHRGRLINDDAAGDLASFNSHTQVNGTYVPNDPDDEVLFGVIDKIMSFFE
jgi:hypothetical protein